MTTLLSIDWDWVTGDCADSENICCGWCEPMPRTRLGRGTMKHIDKRWREKLALLRSLSPVDPGGRFHVAECHADILRAVKANDTRRILHLDSHLDDADWIGLCCGSWRTFLPSSIEVVPTERVDLARCEFHDVFICQLSPWTPASLDRHLWALVDHMADAVGRDPEFIGHARDRQVRTFEQAMRKRGNQATEARL